MIRLLVLLLLPAVAFAQGVQPYAAPSISRARGSISPGCFATNLAIYSEALTDAAWLASGTIAAAPIRTGNAAEAPSGTVTAERLQIAAVANVGERSALAQGFTGTAEPYTFSIYLKGVSGSGTVPIYFYQATPIFRTATICAFTSTAWSRCP